MSRHKWFLVSTLAAAAIPFAACSNAASTTGTGAATSVHSTSSAGTGGADCMGIFQSGTCESCLVTSCCAQLSACNDDTTMSCVGCFGGDTTGGLCAAPQTAKLLSALQQCQAASCAVACPPPLVPACDAPATSPSGGSCFTPAAGGCNPVSSAGCDGGAACDTSMSGFECYAAPPPNTAALCAACSSGDGPECLPGSTCIGNVCVKFCCDDGDCGSGSCDKSGTTSDPGVGLCLKAAPVDAGAG
jgi:hypothetical protein